MIKTIDTNMLTKEMIKAFYERVTVTTLGTLYNADDGIRALLEAAPAVEPVLNTCLSNAKQEPAQAVGKAVTVGGYPDDSQHTVEWLVKHKDLHDGQLLYTVPPAIDYDTKRMVMELCRNVMQNVASWSLADDAEAILEKLGEGNGN